MNITNIEGINGKKIANMTEGWAQRLEENQNIISRKESTILNPAEGLDFISKYLIIKQLENQYPW